jgi:hypothetical protein
MLTEGNIKKNHIYLREFFGAFPKDVVGGSNIAAAAQKTISVEREGEVALQLPISMERKSSFESGDGLANSSHGREPLPATRFWCSLSGPTITG